MDMLTELNTIYDQYAQDAAMARKNASAFDGLLGMGDDWKKHYCHDMFYDHVGEWTERFLQTAPTAADAAKAVQHILEAAALHREEESYWYYYAAQNHAKSIIPLLAPEVSRQICVWYKKTYPRLEWMPAQKQVYQLLSRQAKTK